MRFIQYRRSGLWLRGLTFFLAVSIVFRCSPQLIYRWGAMEYAVLAFFSFLSLNRSVEAPGLLGFELLLLIYPLFFLTAEELSKYMVFTVLGIYYYFRIQSECEAFGAIRLPIICFGVFTAAVTWFSYAFPAVYTARVLPLLGDATALQYQFSRRNMYMGFTNHYSRNGFYIAVAAQLLFAELFCGKGRHRVTRILLLGFLCLTELLVAKRGPLLYLIGSVLLTVVWKQEGPVERLKQLIKYGIAILVLGGLAVALVPGADNIVVRIVASMQTGDVTTGRLELYQIGLRMFLEHPVFGAGWDGFRRLMSDTTYQGVHNDYIQLLGELGIVGCFVVLASNLGILICTLRAYRFFRNDCWRGSEEQVLLTFSLAYQLFVWMDSITGLPHFSYEIYTLYLMAGGYGVGRYLAAYGTLREREGETTE